MIFSRNFDHVVTAGSDPTVAEFIVADPWHDIALSLVVLVVFPTFKNSPDLLFTRCEELNRT